MGKIIDVKEIRTFYKKNDNSEGFVQTIWLETTPKGWKAKVVIWNKLHEFSEQDINKQVKITELETKTSSYNGKTTKERHTTYNSKIEFLDASGQPINNNRMVKQPLTNFADPTNSQLETLQTKFTNHSQQVTNAVDVLKYELAKLDEKIKVNHNTVVSDVLALKEMITYNFTELYKAIQDELSKLSQITPEKTTTNKQPKT